jgi:peroxiredoxin
MHALLVAALIVAWVLVAALAGLLYMMVIQHGKVLIEQGELEKWLMEMMVANLPPGPSPDERQGLPVGDEAPAFALPDLDGREHRLEDYRGEPFVLAFFSPTCGYCVRMSPRLGEIADSRKLVLVTRGEVDENRRLADEHGWNADILQEEEWEVTNAYQATGTPSGYLIDGEGRIASELAMGEEGVLGLLQAEPIVPEQGDATGNGHRSGTDATVSAGAWSGGGMRLRDTTDSKLVRDGLEAGTIAPTFVLPDLEGRSRSLLDYRGKKVLLVFSGVNCVPCEALAPELVRLSEQRSDDLEVVMISRGDTEQNRRKADQFGYPFPVLLQRSWEVSKQYGRFATPIGYLIDEDGVIARDVAAGVDSILALAER